MRSVLRSLAIPLVLVALLAGVLGFIVTRSIAGDGVDSTAKVSVVGIPPTPTPIPTPAPSPTDDATGGRTSRTRRDPRCPSGCECSFPPGGTVVVCRGGGGLTIP